MGYEEMMGLLTPLLGGVALISTIMYMAHEWKAQIETNYAYKLEAQTHKLEGEYKEKTALLTGKHADEMHKKDLEAIRTKNTDVAKIRELTQNLEVKAHEKPYETGNLYEYRLKRLMCLISSGDNQGSSQTCNRFEASPEDYNPRFAAILTVTEETTEGYKKLCEDGELDYCRYTMLALTTRGAEDLLLDLQDIYLYQLRLNFGEVARIKALKDLMTITDDTYNNDLTDKH